MRFALYATLLLATPVFGNDRPNVVVILADDLGFSDLGCYGGEISTPNLDRLAKNGLRFTQFYNTARCWPTRAALLTGYYPQQIRRDRVPGADKKTQRLGRRPAWAPLLPKLLAASGYRSYHSGKWHIDGRPIRAGFDRSYYLQDCGRFFSPRRHFEDGEKLPAVERGTDYYATSAIADHAIRCLRKHHAKSPKKPFFSYVAFTAPHFPLHALPADIARYDGKYDSGWKSARRNRFDRLRELGIVTCALSPVERNVGPPYPFPKQVARLGAGEVIRPLPWDDMTNEQRSFQSAKMALHAAMVDRMDREIGRIVETLRAIDALDDTLVLFLSDNGASAEIMVRDDGHDGKAAPGSAATHLCLGPGWSTVANTPFRRHKTWVHEGGIATPCIAHWPKGIEARGELRRQPGHVIDFVPTILELAKVTVPADPKRPTRPGRNLAPAFAADGSVERDFLWWAHEGNLAIRMGSWKLVRAKGSAWELYDLASDRSETKNRAAELPERVAAMQKKFYEQARAFDPR